MAPHSVLDSPAVDYYSFTSGHLADKTFGKEQGGKTAMAIVASLPGLVCPALCLSALWSLPDQDQSTLMEC